MTHRTRQPYVSRAEQRLRRQARQGWAVIAACALAFGGALYGAAELDARQVAPAAQVAPSQSWQLVQHYRGDTFILDHGLTHDDCDDATPRNQAAKHLRFSCELEG